MGNYDSLRQHLDEYWNTASEDQSGWRYRLSNLVTNFGNIPLPNPFVPPNHEYFAKSQYYWDSYFTILGMVKQNREQALIAKGMVENLAYLYKRMGVVPMYNNIQSFGRTQPPYLTRLAWEVYEAKVVDRLWLLEIMDIADKEYLRVWNKHKRYLKDYGLSRYYPKLFKSKLAVYESGWDLSTRFANNQAELIPIDLNCQLYVYERDFAKLHRKLGDSSLANRFDALADQRRERINNLMWDEDEGFYFDYDTKLKQLTPLATLAGFFPLWAGVASAEQAERMIASLKKFEFKHGLSSSEEVPWRGRQWDYPNAWPPLQYIVITGLKDYGYETIAKRLAKKWLDLNQTLLERDGTLWEKHDVVAGEPGKSGLYPTQKNFAWTAGVATRLLADFDLK